MVMVVLPLRLFVVLRATHHKANANLKNAVNAFKLDIAAQHAKEHIGKKEDTKHNVKY